MTPLNRAEAAVSRALRDIFEDESFKANAGDHLQHDLGLDSMTFLQLAIHLEDFIQAPLGEDPEELPETVRDLVELVAQRLEVQSHVA